MDQTILYYNNETNALYFNEYEDFEYVEKGNTNADLLILAIYLLGFYHLSWYIVDMSRSFFTQDLVSRLNESKLIFRILNENLEIFDAENVESMNTDLLLDETLKFFDENYRSENSCESGTTESESESESESDEHTHTKEEIDVAKTLTSMGKNWEYEH